MKRRYFAFLALLGVLPALTACAQKYDYTKHLSEVKSDIFRAETEEFTVTVSCVSREYPYLPDGVPCPRSDSVEISLVPVRAAQADYFVYLDGSVGGETSFRSAHGDYFYSEGVERFPEGTVTVSVEWGQETREFSATSVKNENTLSPEEALSFAIEAEKDRVGRMTGKNGFCGEFYVRLLRRDRTYYYVAIVSADGTMLAMLLDSETGEPLARRETRVIP